MLRRETARHLGYTVRRSLVNGYARSFKVTNFEISEWRDNNTVTYSIYCNKDPLLDYILCKCCYLTIFISPEVVEPYKMITAFTSQGSLGCLATGLQVEFWVCQWKNLDGHSILEAVMTKIFGGFFRNHSVDVTRSNFEIATRVGAPVHFTPFLCDQFHLTNTILNYR